VNDNNIYIEDRKYILETLKTIQETMEDVKKNVDDLKQTSATNLHNHIQNCVVKTDFDKLDNRLSFLEKTTWIGIGIFTLAGIIISLIEKF
jgi:uncharacterized protein YicC (UPF0701 family)